MSISPPASNTFSPFPNDCFLQMLASPQPFPLDPASDGSLPQIDPASDRPCLRSTPALDCGPQGSRVNSTLNDDRPLCSTCQSKQRHMAADTPISPSTESKCHLVHTHNDRRQPHRMKMCCSYNFELQKPVLNQNDSWR